MRTLSLRGWAIAATGLGLFFAALLSCTVRGVAECNAELRVVAEPRDWRSWPELRDLGGYRVEGERLMQKYGLGMRNTELRDDALCPRGGVSLDGWFSGGPDPSYMRTAAEVHLRALDGTFVASAAAQHGPAEPALTEEKFVVAFRRETGRRFRFVSARTEGFALAFLVGLVGLIAGAFVGRLSVIGARKYPDLTRYKPGNRIPSGEILFDDGSPPLRPPGEAGASGHVAGPVLVRVDGTTDGSYRTAPSTKATRIATGDAATLCRAASVRARAVLRGASLFAMVVLLACAVAVIVQWVDDIAKSLG
jgi:hypothetical protein